MRGFTAGILLGSSLVVIVFAALHDNAAERGVLLLAAAIAFAAGLATQTIASRKRAALKAPAGRAAKKSQPRKQLAHGSDDPNLST